MELTMKSKERNVGTRCCYMAIKHKNTTVKFNIISQYDNNKSS